MDEFTSDIADAVDTDEAVRITQDLVRAPSENPPGREHLAAAVARQWLEAAGCEEIEEIEEIEGRTNLTATWGDPSSSPRLIFNGHLDVVPAADDDGWNDPPFSAVVRDGRIFGRGTSDMKSGIAAMIEAVIGLNRIGFKPAGHIQFQLVADEESFGRHGTEFLLRKNLLAGDAAVIGEPTSLMICLGERGAYWATIHATGRAAHGSVPEQGISAIEKVAKAAIALHGRDFDDSHPLLGKPTLNVGTIAGGTKVNVVADRASISIDRRAIPGETEEAVQSEIEAILDEVKAGDPDCEFKVEVFGFAEPSIIGRDEPIVRLLARSVESQTGGPPDYYGSPGATDARFLRNQGRIPAVVFGPGIMGAAHTVNEFADVASIGIASKVYAELAHRFFSSWEAAG